MSLIRRFVRQTVSLTILLITTGLLLGWFLVLRPTSLGGPASYVLVSGPSMEPTFQTGDLVITRRADAYAVGDVVLFRVKKALVIHRIVGGDPASGFLVRGDHNQVEDGFRPTSGAIDGKVWLRLPGVGQAVVFVRQPLPLAICTWALTSLLLLRRWSRPRAMPATDPVPVKDA